MTARTTGFQGTEAFDEGQFRGILKRAIDSNPDISQRYGGIWDQIDVVKNAEGRLRLESNTLPQGTLNSLKRALRSDWKSVPHMIVQAQPTPSSTQNTPQNQNLAQATPVEVGVQTDNEMEALDLSELSLDEIKALAPLISGEAIRSGRRVLTRDVLNRIRDETPTLYGTVPDPIRKPRVLH